MGPASQLAAHPAIAAAATSSIGSVEDAAIRPFRFNAPDEALTDLRSLSHMGGPVRSSSICSLGAA
jgi:hypothetical protein